MGIYYHADMERTNDEHIASLKSLLGKKLPAERDALKDIVRELEMRFITTIELRVQAHANLLNKRLQYLHPKDAQYTDMDRKIMLDANTSAEQAAYDLHAGMEEALRQRIEVIQVLLVQ